jgi:hypothetical protein
VQPGSEAFECATAVVPLDYDRPKGKQTTLALARLQPATPAAGSAHRS